MTNVLTETKVAHMPLFAWPTLATFASHHPVDLVVIIAVLILLGIYAYKNRPVGDALTNWALRVGILVPATMSVSEADRERRVAAMVRLADHIHSHANPGFRSERRLQRHAINATAEMFPEVQRRLAELRAARKGRRPVPARTSRPRMLAHTAALLLATASTVPLFMFGQAVSAVVALVLAVAAGRLCRADAIVNGYWNAIRHTETEAEAVKKANRAVRERCALALRATRPPRGEGYVYIVEYSSNTVKVGQTIDPQTRLGKHRRDAEAHGVVIVDYWVSGPHRNYLANEKKLIDFGMRTAPRKSKNEYFHDVDLATVRQFAASLTYDSRTADMVEVAR